MKKYLKGVFILIVLFVFVNYVSASTEIDEIRLTSSTTSVKAGVLSSYEVSTSTLHASVEEYGSNTGWLKMEEGHSSWNGFGYDTPVAINDGKTKYALRIKIILDDGYSFNSETKVYFNDEDVTNNGDTEISVFDWGGYVNIDLGKATGENINVYTVSFNTDGGNEIDSQKVPEGYTARRPYDPVKEGYTFGGWYLNSESENAFDFETPITKNTTLIAKWVSAKKIEELRLNSSTTKPTEGLLGEFTVTTATEHIELSDYGDNTGWMKWGEGNTSWNGFGDEKPIALADGKTHYGLRLCINVKDGYQINSETKVFFNGVDVSSNEKTEIDVYSWGAYVYIDLGVIEKSSTPDTPTNPETPAVLTTPKISVEKGPNNTLYVNWDFNEAATRYEVYRSTSNNKKSKWTKFDTIDSSSYEQLKLTYGKTYYYKVKACNETECTGYSNVASKKVVPDKVDLSVTSAGEKNVKLSWNKVDATGYEVYMGKKKVATIKKAKTVTYNKKKLKTNTKYTFKVRAYKTVKGKKIYGAWSEVVTTMTTPVKPKVSLSIKEYNEMNIKIAKVKGASKYVVEKSLDGKTYTSVEELPTYGTLTQGDLEVGKTYYYRVKACNAYTCGKWTTVSKKQTTLAPKLSLATESKKVTVTVTAVNGADGYEVYRSTSKKKGYKLQGDTTDLVLENATKKGKTYYYKVRSYKLVDGKKVYSPYSGIKKIKSK